MSIAVLLRGVWIAAIVPIIVASIPCRKLDDFHHLMLLFAGRGKIMQSSSNKFTVPQKFFSQFYVLGVLWTSLLLTGTWFYAYTMHPRQYGICSSVFMLLLMELQLLRRLYESIYLFNYSPSARMHILGYLTGLYFYTAAPLSLCCNYAPEVFNFALDLVQEFIVKGKHRMQIAEVDWWGVLHPFMQLRWYAWIGAVLFLWGWIHQHRCHGILGSLRENHEHVDEYAIPHGDWFKYVSSPHYLAEIVIYLGLLVSSGFSDLTICLLFGFVVTNLVLAAAETQRWYKRKFDNYPRDRFTIFPFVY
ncbi:hypothetical protein LIER_21547 [Lithospermum erythrorhizon]|uniref:3-oxo-5-alpha-steroid 4-dehydrogenase C-terminal domain-containing protein n=1 Tax=Lithospermum erythrorhizon TaxID=34254 RepID=A0AAV3QUT0_LITER